MNDDKELLKPYLLEAIQIMTEKSRNGGKNQYICPFCGSGKGNDHSGAFTFYPETNTYHCFSCGKSGDIFTFYAEINKMDIKSDFSRIMEELKLFFNISSSVSQPITPKTPNPEQSEPRDYTRLFYVAEQHLHETDYLTRRGISVETQQRFHCGYIDNYSYFNGTKSTSAIIIPTSDSSYMWRSTTENVKHKRGTAHIFNADALSSPCCFVVEGEIDCMSVEDYGFACIGLGSTSHIRKIFDFDTSKTVLILALDNDKAGKQATVELSKLCDEYNVPYIVADRDIWGDCKDANELMVKDQIQFVTNLQKHYERALSLDKDKYFIDKIDRQQSDSDWRSKLLLNRSNNAIKDTLHNIYTILNNDITYKKKIRFNELKQLRMFSDSDWSDYLDCRIKLYLEETYNLMTSLDFINQACTLIEHENSFHPIKEYLNSLQWDGIHRIRSVFSDFLGAVDNIYTQSVAVVTFVGAVARVFQPGVKFDTCTVFVGKQGTGKSKFISKIAVKPEWFTDGVTTFDGKDFYESIQGKWIIELGEGTAFQKSVKERCKQAIASQQDFYRKPYGRHPEERPRQCVFLGTTNNYDFLKDETGDRRYYPIDVNITNATKNIDSDLTPQYVGLLWAEALHLYKSGQSVYIQDSQVLALAEQEQRKHFDESPLQADIYNFLEVPITPNWYTLDLVKRGLYFAQFRTGNVPPGCIKRDRISVKEIVCELFGYELDQPIDRRFSLEIARALTALGWKKTGSGNRIYPYGYVKVYKK